MLRCVMVLFASVSSCFTSVPGPNVVFPNTDIRLFDMRFIRVDIVKCDEDRSAEKPEEIGSMEAMDSLEDENIHNNYNYDDSAHPKDDYSFLEPIECNKSTKEQLLDILDNWS